MLISEERCSKYTDCASCDKYQKHIFKFRSYPRGVFVPREKCSRNVMYFILKGEIWVNSAEHPDSVIREGQFFLQPVGSLVEFRIHTPTECILYTFDQVMNVCEERDVLSATTMQASDPVAEEPVVLSICSPLQKFLEGLKFYLTDDLLCSDILKAKRSELSFLLNCYYPIKEITGMYSAVHSYNRSFKYFVMNNYQRVKDVEHFARLGGYSTPTFRRIFKETFEEPAYKWMLRRKCEDIHSDLKTTDMTITEICNKYGFESLANFSHFCRQNFGKSPRNIRADD